MSDILLRLGRGTKLIGSLQAHFAANPLDLAYLRHDTPLHPARAQSHLKHIPNYLQPKIAGIHRVGDVRDSEHVAFARKTRDGGDGVRGRGGSRGRGRGRGHGGGRGGGGRGGRGKVDPLKFKG